MGIRRKTLKTALGLITNVIIKKHGIKVVLITGEKSPSIVKELIYNIISQKYNVRRNLERIESEFSIPLTVIGELVYPKNYLTWIRLIIKTAFQIIYLRPYPHFLVIQINYIDKDIFNYWIDKLSPILIVNTDSSMQGKHIKPLAYIKLNKLDIDKVFDGLIPDSLKRLCKKIDINTSDIHIGIDETLGGNPRIKIIPSINNSLIIDARHYYYPPNLNSVLEIVEAIPSKYKYLFSHNKSDLNGSTKNLNLISSINKLNKHHKNSVYIFRGRRDEFTDEIRTLSVNKSEI